MIYWLYIKKYWSYITIVIFGILGLIFYFMEKSKEEREKNNAFSLGEIKGRLKEKTDITNLELKALNNDSVVFNNKIDKIKKMKDVNSRRKKINSLLKTLPLLLLFVSCGYKQIEYPSFLPPKIDTNQIVFDSNNITIEKTFGRIAFDHAEIITIDGNIIVLDGGFAFDDYETLNYVQLIEERDRYKRQLILMVDAYNSLYVNSRKAEIIWQGKIDSGLLDEYECEICYTSGLGTCIGILYSVDAVIE